MSLGLCACGGNAAQDEGAQTADSAIQSHVDDPTLPEGALSATWQELGVPGATLRPALAATPTGFFALSQRQLGDAKAPSAEESYLYRSTDGIRWQEVELSAQNENLWLRGIAYGGGHYVLAGMRFGGGDGVIFHSTDGAHWDETAVVSGAPSGLSDVVFAGSRFFALSTFRTLLTSTDGTAWTSIDLKTTVMPMDVAFGAGQFLLVGSGDVQRSSDGLTWAPAQLDCTLPGACISDPDGHVLQGFHSRAVFSDGTFFIDQASSRDGRTWQSLPDQYPFDGVSGYVIGSTATDALAIWSARQAPQPLASVRYLDTSSGADRSMRLRWNGAIEPSELSTESFPNDEPLPEQIDFPIPGGGDCTTASCLVVGDRLYLVPTAL